MFQIIGVLGQSNTGKDVVADWFYRKGFIKLAFSDPMKRYARDLFDYEPLQLWGPSEERNKELVANDPWWMKVVSNWGKATNKFVNELFVHTFSNGHVGRTDAYLSLMHWLADLRRYTQSHAAMLSPRVVLQTLGTEWGRKLDPDLWLNYAYGRIVPGLKDGRSYDCEYGLYAESTMTGCPGVIITDHRFYNEVLATRKQDGFVIKLSRPHNPNQKPPGLSGHASEHDQQNSVMPISYELELPEGLDLVDLRLQKLWEDHPWRKS